MEAVATHLNLRWLTEPESEPLRVGANQEELTRTPVPMPEGIGYGWIEMMDLPLGMHICRVVHHFEPGMEGLQPMSDVKVELLEPLFFVQTLRSGQGMLHDRRVDVRLENYPEGCTFQHMDRIDHQHWADVSTSIEAITLGMGQSSLHRLIGEQTAIDLLTGLGIRKVPSAIVQPVPASIRASLQACFADHLTGNLRKLHAQAKVLDFIIALAGHFVGESKPESRKLKLIHELREELDQLHGTVPGLDELAKRYGLSERVMSEEFKREYGQSIFAYISDYRLNAAHAALQCGNLALKVLAAQLGYADASHFSNAFDKKFGYRPGSLRRGAGAMPLNE
ncbi:MAG: helix-turn-helix transcriptional regulator [Proteobacteria bacterium]|nr:helix-turn-helix transcriptional regulator [Pseudomonadota bacterium]